MIFFFFFLEINTFIQQGCIKLIKSDITDIYNVTKDLYFKKMLFIKQHNFRNHKKYFLGSKSAY